MRSMSLTLALVGAVSMATPTLASNETPIPIASSVVEAELAKGKRTKLGLYVTAADAHLALEASPDIIFIDVRSRPEFTFVGHAASVDSNIPYRVIGEDYEIDEERAQYAFDPNIDFPKAVENLLEREGATKDSIIFVTCRSGLRSKGAADLLADSGYTRVYSVVDGFEGDRDPATGHPTINGWRNAGLPWTYQLTEAKAYESPSF
ncbi:MAG: rhodanese-like domain-containing protein [Pseudomonadota bacterium]